MSSKSSAARGEPQYHHAIPRFILRRFIEGPRKTQAQRKKEYRKTGVVSDYVLFYDVAGKTLERRSIGNIYGVMDLYGDQFAADFNELEKKFSRLEQDAAVIIEIFI